MINIALLHDYFILKKQNIKKCQIFSPTSKTLHVFLTFNADITFFTTKTKTKPESVKNDVEQQKTGSLENHEHPHPEIT